ncbi:hypothetical protein SARC_06905 [Sphaeroforma arctica JP610]|uniref:Uncharacterized protein n=1 Tax=Sphaeroforma arctica JP610 TaxID=667725 RepID=A0A0L0FXQ6_9EUKA|nr:hypothetical protein SARC_06905 [Sphaeroforma arctica JP610]KNC80748.1 hypothetical protein SARC_06905 [Sphaeroforma arctica JP610]|eukprot:XP_014154650.1 hypothetical protein SARC_06905 [Sphaeroforma arctica JP610]
MSGTTSLVALGSLWIGTLMFLVVLNEISKQMNLEPIDVILERTGESTLEHIAKYTEESRQMYLYHLTIDSLFPPLYGYTIYSSIYYLKGHVPTFVTRCVALGCLADIVENCSLLYLISLFPESDNVAAEISIPATRVKFGALAIGLGAVYWYTGVLIYQIIFDRESMIPQPASSQAGAEKKDE